MGMGIYRLWVNLSIQYYERKTIETVRTSSDKQSRRATNFADNIVVHGKTTEKHDRNAVALLNRLQERNLTLSKNKCNSGMSQIVFMGLILNEHGVGPTETKVKAIRETKAFTMLHNCKFFWVLSVTEHDSCLISRRLWNHSGR